MVHQTNGVYADHPFPVLSTPVAQLPEGTEPTMFHNMASEMVHIHNIIFRGLNSIYLQAEHITDADVDSFLNYMAQWLRVLTSHHEGEETIFFPAVERLSGEKGIMENNVEQHHAFHTGLTLFGDYVTACLAKKETYSGEKVVEMIDVFGAVLAQHLTEEIGTILALEKFGEKLNDLPLSLEEQAKHGMSEAGLFTGLGFVAANFDRHFENDRWLTTFPPGPGQTAMAVVRNVTYWVHKDWWKFGSCDRTGKVQPLYAAAPLAGGRNTKVTVVDMKGAAMGEIAVPVSAPAHVA
ncbi:hypothetical protein CC79DRAFT_1367922 [Sarocladium strictum]